MSYCHFSQELKKYNSRCVVLKGKKNVHSKRNTIDFNLITWRKTSTRLIKFVFNNYFMKNWNDIITVTTCNWILMWFWLVKRKLNKSTFIHVKEDPHRSFLHIIQGSMIYLEHTTATQNHIYFLNLKKYTKLTGSH